MENILDTLCLGIPSFCYWTQASYNTGDGYAARYVILYELEVFLVSSKHIKTLEIDVPQGAKV